MIYLDSDTDSILPYGLKGTPFETVFMALQAVASTVWPVDAAELRAAIGWGWYLDNNLEELILLSAGKQYIQNILISEQVPLIKSTQTQEELVDLLYRWKNYKPTFDKLEELYIPYAARVDIRPITDEATQEILPVTDIHNAFYVVLTDIDWSRPLTLGEAALIAERATPMGSRPIAVFQFEEATNVYPQLVYGDVNFYTGTFEPAAEPIPPVPQTELAYIIVDEDTGEIVFSQNDPGMEFAEVGTLLMPDSEMILVPESSLPLVTFYLNPEGRNATENHTLTFADNPVFDADGNSILYADYPDLQGNKPFCFMRVDNTFFMGGEGDSLINFSEGKAGIGALASRGKSAWSVSFEVPPSELTAYFTNQGAAGTGNTRIGGSFGDTPATLYDASGNPLPYDLSKKYMISGMYNYSGSSVEVSSYSRILDVNGIVQYIPGGVKNVFIIVLSLSPQTTIDAYFTNAGASATTDVLCQNSITYTLYDADGNFIPYDSTKTYTTVASFVVNGDTAYADFTGNYASWSDTILKGRPSGSNYYYKVVIRVE